MHSPQRPLHPFFVVAALAGAWLSACTLTSDVNSLGDRPGAGAGGRSVGGASGASGAGGTTTQGAGGTGGDAGGGGSGGGTPSNEGFVRFANFMPLFDVEPQPGPEPLPLPLPTDRQLFFALDFCVRSSENEPWRGPLFANELVPALGPSQLSDHMPMAAGPLEAKVLPEGVRDCDAPSPIEARGEVVEGEYLTLAVVSDFDGEPLLASYVDGRPSEGGDGLVEVSFANAFGETEFGLNIEPMGLLIEQLGARQEWVEPGVLPIEVYATDGLPEFGFAPAAPLLITPDIGHSIFFFISSLTGNAPSTFLCENGEGRSVSPRARPSSTCAFIELLPFGTPIPFRRPAPR